MNDLKDLRMLDLATLCAAYGLQQDINDRRQFKGDNHRITLNANGFAWYDHTEGTGGGGAINLAMHLYAMSFNDAVKWLESIDLSSVSVTKSKATPKQSNSVIPVRFDSNLSHVMDYLTIKRGINAQLVAWCVDKGMIYADGYKNAVFMYGKTGCELCGTGNRKWKGARGTIEHGFLLPSKDIELAGIALVESAIDALSYRQLKKRAVVAIKGSSNDKIMRDIVQYTKTKNVTIFSAFDNDKAGNSAHDNLKQITKQYGHYLLVRDRPRLKDWNEDLKTAV